ncbi:aminodeoxychorismate synthase component I [Winkia sp. UMB10116]|uniref:aminodeoxychorismate synthase component I n=1 Tax=Winkia sp. UMB10116 TaxID=3046355 RepID=UPI002553DCB1|nr:aminodeoxychorismate synthase component I [Winkia sp. UMB10116]MDK6241177.1 aminodeoxychorismate synthase component I [Winkia sp. UMB10116]
MGVLLIDNHDSFTYNLAHLVFAACGQMPQVVIAEDVTDIHLAAADRIIVSAGPGRPAEYPWFPGIFLDPPAPTLGICLGFQGLCEAYGAKLGTARYPRHGEVTGGRMRYHSLEITDLPACLTATEWDEDGTLLGVAHKSLPLWGVQYHPESVGSTGGVELMRNFLSASAQQVGAGLQGEAQTGHAPAGPASYPGSPATSDSPHPPATPGPPSSAPVKVWYEKIDTDLLPEALFAANFLGQSHAAWLDSSDGSGWHYLCSGTPVPSLERAPLPEADTTGVPCAFALGMVGYLTYEGKAHFISVDKCLAISPNGEVWALGYEPWQVNTAASPVSALALPDTPRTFRFSREQYLAKIAQAQEEIAKGNAYELCLTNSISFPALGDPYRYYLHLRSKYPAPFASFLRFGGRAVLSTSPERFLSLSSSGVLEAKPIKGTRPRGHTPAEDEALRDDLATSVKDRAENLMICDLLRNDLGRVAVPGSVEVPVVCGIESFSYVHQMVSTIRARKRGDVSALDCIRAAFPGGSMTGAPKERSMRILERLEEGHLRGIYSGAIGYISLSGAMDLSITIRTALIEGGKASYGCGGAITRLSDPQEEWEEILTKARPILSEI